MAIGWGTRIERAFTFAQLREATEGAVRELLAMSDRRLTVEVMASRDYYSGGFPIQPKPVPAELIEAEHRQQPGHKADIVLVLRELQAATTVSIVGNDADPYEPDDPDAGVHCMLSAQRDPVSCVLTIACAIAAARTTGSMVWDESLGLSDDRIGDPNRIMRRLQAEPGLDLTSAINAVLGRTRIGFTYSPTGNNPPES